MALKKFTVNAGKGIYSVKNRARMWSSIAIYKKLLLDFLLF